MNDDAGRPGDWLGGYGAFGSPITEGGVSSPKKKLSSFGCDRDHGGHDSSEGLKAMPSLMKDKSSSHDDEDFVEVLDETTEGDDCCDDSDVTDEYEEIVEYEEEEVVEVEDSDDEEEDSGSGSDFDPLPEPVEIPEYLKPADNETAEEVVVEEEEEVEQEENQPDGEEIRMAPKCIIHPMRPKIVRGHSCDSDVQEAAGAVRRGKKKPAAKADEEKGGEEEEEEEEEPEVPAEKPYVVTSPKPKVESPKPKVAAAAAIDAAGTAPRSPPLAGPAPAAPRSPGRRRDDDDSDDDKHLSWKKPDWCAGVKLRATGKGEKLKTDGNLAAPITSLPHQKQEGPFSKPDWTGPVQNQTPNRPQGKLEKPITELPHVAAAAEEKDLTFKKPDWAVQGPNLHATKKGEKLKSGKDIARPIGGIKPADA